MSRDQQDARQARAAMEEAKAQAESKRAPYDGPRRYKVYDRIKDHVSLGAVNAVIIITALLIVVLLFYGIATGTPQ